MGDVYREFVVPNGLTYPQKPDSLKIYAGYNRLRLTWLRAKDPSIVRAEICWNNYIDTLNINIPDDRDIVVDIPNLDEGSYTFYIKTFDADGNVSVPVEISGSAYGDNYRRSVTNRVIKTAFRDAGNRGTVNWGAKTSDLIYSELRYRTVADSSKTVRVLPSETVTDCPDAKPNTPFEYRSVFLPAKGIDTVAIDWATHDTPFLYKYSRAEWTAEAKDGYTEWGAAGGEPSRILDGDMTTGWYAKPDSALPGCIVIDMQQLLPVAGVAIYPPTDPAQCHLKNIEIYLSATPKVPDHPQPSWGKPAAAVEYPGPNGADFTVNFLSASSARYVVLVFTTSTSDNSDINLMEVEVFGL
jgi:hypothetical protein